MIDARIWTYKSDIEWLQDKTKVLQDLIWEEEQKIEPAEHIIRIWKHQLKALNREIVKQYKNIRSIEKESE